MPDNWKTKPSSRNVHVHSIAFLTGQGYRHQQSRTLVTLDAKHRAIKSELPRTDPQGGFLVTFKADPRRGMKDFVPLARFHCTSTSSAPPEKTCTLRPVLKHVGTPHHAIPARLDWGQALVSLIASKQSEAEINVPKQIMPALLHSQQFLCKWPLTDRV